MTTTATLRTFLIATLTTWFVGAAARAAPDDAEGTTPRPGRQSLRVYHLGNSVTDTLRYKAFAQLVASRGHRYTWGRHTIPGSPLHGLWVSPEKGASQEPYGSYKRALRDFEWDVLTLQPFDRQLDRDLEPDLDSCVRFIDLALGRSPDLDVYVYARWPKRVEFKEKGPDGEVRYKPFDYAERWRQPYTGKWDNGYETRDYFRKLADKLNERYAGKLKRPVRVIPVGEALFVLDRKIKAGEVPGVASIEDLYKDNVHFGDVGSYVVGLTFYATLYGDDPRGLPGRPYGVRDEALARAAQEAAWEAVGGDRDAPVPEAARDEAPEPVADSKRDARPDREADPARDDAPRRAAEPDRARGPTTDPTVKDDGIRRRDAKRDAIDREDF